MCPICKIAYGMEEPRCEELKGSNNFLAVVDVGNKTRPHIVILPKKPEISLTFLAREGGELYDEFEKIAMEAAKKYEEKYRVKSFMAGNLAVPCGKILHQYLVLLPATMPQVEES